MRKLYIKSIELYLFFDAVSGSVIFQNGWSLVSYDNNRDTYLTICDILDVLYPEWYSKLLKKFGQKLK